ncbi:MAG: trimethylamine methyltransferase, partial [Chloroflexi bacterium]
MSIPNAPLYDYLPNEGIETIHEMTLRVLEEFGIAFNHDQAVDILERAGCQVDRDAIPAPLVKFPRGLVLEQIGKAPREFTMYARNPQNNVVLGGKHTVLAPVYGPPNVQDLDKGRREATLEDYRNFVKLAQSVPEIHNAGGVVCEPNDEPQATRHLDMMHALLTLSDKTFMGNVVSGENANDCVELAAIVFGGRDKLAQTPAM